MSKLTSVEWLRDKIFEEFRFTFSDNILDEAKEMHKREIIDAHISGYDSSGGGAEDYYDAIYKSLKQPK